MNSYLRRVTGRTLLGCLLLGVNVTSTFAGEVDITAEFRPDPSNPMVNRFKNTTPSSGFCENFLANCESRGLFSLNLPLGSVPQTTGGPLAAGSTDPRRGGYFKVPSEWRWVTVTNEHGDTAELEVRISGIGGRYDIGGHVGVITGGGGHFDLWGKRWIHATPCVFGAEYGGPNNLIWFYMVPENAGVCAPQQALFDIPDFHLRYVHFGYELRSPNPLAMPAGIYRGSPSYSIGPGMDFDFGDHVVPHDNIAILNFTLDVDHIFNVDVPPGGKRVLLEPQDGWQAWLQNGRKPSRLFRDQTVGLWTSTAFKMTLECPEPLGNTCSLRNVAGHQVPLDIAVSLPPGLTDATGRPVNRQPLTLDGSGTELFQPSRYIDRKPSTLHFQVQAAAVEQMLEHPGSTYSGTATVIWDSAI